MNRQKLLKSRKQYGTRKCGKKGPSSSRSTALSIPAKAGIPASLKTTPLMDSVEGTHSDAGILSLTGRKVKQPSASARGEMGTGARGAPIPREGIELKIKPAQDPRPGSRPDERRMNSE